jgi:DNA-binding response OmpR family regulator
MKGLLTIQIFRKVSEQTMTKILVIDDDVNTTWLMDNIFSKVGYEIHSVNNSNFALPEALTVKPDLIILDLIMPGVDGIKTCQALQTNPDTKSIPILMFSAVGDVSSKVEAFNAGARDFITKPVHVEELKSRIRNWLNHKYS